MKITELLHESQQLDEGPFTQAVGKVGGKIAKGIANVGKDLKTGFKAGYSGEQPAAAPRDPDVPMNPTTGKPLTEPERKAHQAAGGQFDGETGDLIPLANAAAPAKKAGGLKGAIDQFKQGFAQGQEEPTAPAASNAAAAPAVDPAAEKASKIGVGQINKIIPTLRTRDLMSIQANLEKTIASKKKAAPADAAPAATTPPAAKPAVTAPTDAEAPPKRTRKTKAKTPPAAPSQAEIDADRARLGVGGSESISRTGASLSEMLASKVQEQKQRMFETALVSGTHSIFKK